MEAEFEAKLKALNISEKTIGEIQKKKKLQERLKTVLAEAKIEKCEKEVGQMLVLVAEKLNPTYNHRLPLLLKYVISKQIATSHQLDVSIDFLKKKGEEVITEEEFETKTGINLKLTEDDLRKAVLESINAHIDQIKLERYLYPSNTILYELKAKFTVVDAKLSLKIINEEISKLLGGKNEIEKEEEKLRGELEVLKKKQKEMKKTFPEEDKKKMDEIKGKLKKISDEVKAKIDAAKKSEKKEESKPEDDDKVDEKDKLSSLMARDMKSALNPPHLLKKHLDFTGGKVITRFPPEPNGYLHIGHAKAMRFSFTSASAVGGHTYLRLDDTNPEKETKEFIDSIEENVQWLGYKPWKITYASNYFQDLYDIAIKLIKEGKAYVCNQSKAEMSEYRNQKRDSPYRNRTVEENLKLFEMMKQGRFEEKECCLRMKIDMKHNNPCMRDPVAYRIKYVPHPHLGNKWCIYPTYDFTHCLNDSLENITHSLCTLEFEIRRDSYYWLLEAADMYRPFVWEYSRLNLTRNVLSKRKLTQLVTTHTVNGWDDPRMLTINGLRRRGYTNDAINAFIDSVGVTRRGNENIISIKVLENAIKNDLDKKAQRTMAVIDPIKVVLSNVKENTVYDSYLFPKLKEQGGVRKVTLSKVIYIDRVDFRETDDKNFFGLTPKQEVGLKYAGSIKVDEVKKDAKGKVIELVCTYSGESKKLKGRIHWISEVDGVRSEVRLYDYIFKSDDPTHADDENSSHDPMDDLNPKSLIVKLESLVHKDICKETKAFDHYQFERLGYFATDPDTKEGRYIFNLTVDLGDGKIDAMRE